MEFLSSALYALKPRFDDDLVDRYNYYYTTSLLLVFSIFVSAKQWVGQPIECWVPAFFKGAWEEYAEDYCFIQNTYWLPLHGPMPTDIAVRKSGQLGYYQWVPFILAGQAVFFYSPYLIWWLFSWQTGIDVHSLVSSCKKIRADDPEDEDGGLSMIASYFKDCLHATRMSGRPAPQCVNPAKWGEKAEGYYLTVLYLIVKLLYLINCIVQLFFMNYALRTGNSSNGIWIFWDFVRGRSWEESGNFPRVTMCDFEVKVLGNLHRYTVQCVLLINLFNEKIFFILWVWVLLGVFLNLISLVRWACSIFVDDQRQQRIVPYLDNLTDSEERSKCSFVRDYLQADGVLVLDKLRHHIGSTAVAKVVRAMFVDYVKSNDIVLC